MAVEDALRSRLGAVRPDDGILGAERGQTGSVARRWIIDGIDGTVDFAAGKSEWGTLIALEVGGRVVMGVCDQPAHRRRYWAVRGCGAFHTLAHADEAHPLYVMRSPPGAAARSTSTRLTEGPRSQNGWSRGGKRMRVP